MGRVFEKGFYMRGILTKGGGILAMGGGYFGLTHDYLYQDVRYAIGKWFGWSMGVFIRLVSSTGSKICHRKMKIEWSIAVIYSAVKKICVHDCGH